MLITAHCAGCNEPGTSLCHRCRFALASVPAVRAESGVRAAFEFDGVARQAVLGLKYRNRRRVAASLAALLVRRIPVGQVDVVTWAPTSARRAGERGFDQAELLARAVARVLGVPCRRMLYRQHGPADAAQTGKTRRQRLLGPSFRARAPQDGLRVLLVDDVVTTGSTLAAAAQALRAAGVDHVTAVAVAATRGRQMAARRRTVAMASLGSSSTSTPIVPAAAAAATLVATSPRNAVRGAEAPSLARAS